MQEVEEEGEEEEERRRGGGGEGRRTQCVSGIRATSC